MRASLLLVLCLWLPLVARADWTSQLAGSQDLYDLWGSGPDDLYAVGAAGAIYHSTDGGKTWTLEKSGVSEPLFTVWGSGSENVYAAGDNGTILRSTDRGKSWTPLVSPQLVAFRAMYGFGENDLYLVGDQGTILHSVDGVTFTAQSSGTLLSLQSVWGSSASDIYTVGDSGVILHTADSGKTWTASSSGTTETLRGVWGSGPDNIFVVGYHTTILQSQDQGKTWQARLSGGVEWLGGIWGSSDKDILAVGARGLLLRSQDGGKSFVPEKTGNTSPLYAVWGTSERLVRIVGRNGTLLRRTLPDPVLTVNATTPGARLFIDNVEMASSSVTLQLKPGKHQIIIKNDPEVYEDRIELIELEEGEIRGIDLESVLIKTFTLFLNNPDGVEGAEVSLDGKYRGKTPLYLRDVKLGKHELKVHAEGFDDVVQVLDVSQDMLALELKMKKTLKLPTFVQPKYLLIESAVSGAIGLGLWGAAVNLLRVNLKPSRVGFAGSTEDSIRPSQEEESERAQRGQGIAAGGDVFMGVSVSLLVARFFVKRSLETRQRKSAPSSVGPTTAPASTAPVGQ